MTPDPTDAELDKWERHAKELNASPYISTAGWIDLPIRVGHLIKALRACRAQSKAKDAVVEALGGATAHETMLAIAWAGGVQSSYEREGVTKQAKGLLGTAIKCLRVLDNALAALDKGTDD